MLKIQDISFAIEGKPLFENASAVIPTGHKVGIVGRNGTGKTSLFRMIRGEWALDSGVIEWPAHFRVGGVDQEAPASDDSLLATVLAADTERHALLAEAETATDPTRIADIQIRLADIGAFSAEARAATILSGLGFDHEAQQRACREYSGGWRMRVALAAVLFSEPDLLLLDEPTNYLDLEGTIWLENFLAKYNRTVLVISHDRDLLNKSVTGILHLSDCKLAYYTGGYDQFDTERRLKLEQMQAVKRKQDAQRAHIQSFVDRFRYKATKARQAQSRLKQLAKMQPIAALSESAVAPFSFPTPDPLAPPLLTTDRAVVGYDDTPVLRHLNVRLDADDRIALLGANGQGKSTLSKLLADRLPLMAGTLFRANKLRVGFFAQHQLDELVPGETPFDHMARLRPGELPTKIRSRLGGAGINADIMDNPVERLSGGQKARLLMAMAAIDAPHILILDEPTNHLDIESREALVHALNDYEGAIILVSHDSHLVEMVADRLWLVRDGGVEVFDGDMADYKRLLLSQRGGKPKHNTSADDAESAGAGGAADGGAASTGGGRQLSGQEKRRLTGPLRIAISKAEKQIATLTTEKTKIEGDMAAPGFFDSANNDKAMAATQRLKAIEAELEAAEMQWLEAQSELEAFAD